MTLNSLPLSYCTNVHPGLTVAEILQKLDEFTIPIQQQLGAPLAAGLWLAEPVIKEILATPDGHIRFAEEIHKRNLTCYTLNAFPFGNFHSDRVKENVYLPDWSDRKGWNTRKVVHEFLPHCCLKIRKAVSLRYRWDSNNLNMPLISAKRALNN